MCRINFLFKLTPSIEQSQNFMLLIISTSFNLEVDREQDAAKQQNHFLFLFQQQKIFNQNNYLLTAIR